MRKGLAGLLAGLPVGLALYYVPVISLAELVAASSSVRLARLLDWNPATVLGLVLCAAVTEWGLYRASARRGLQPFFWGQAASALLICAPLFVSTAVHHNPVLPFYGQ